MRKKHSVYSWFLTCTSLCSLILFVFCVNNVLAASKKAKSAASSKQPEMRKIAIRGTISNIASAKKYLRENSVLVLYHSDKGIRMRLMSDASYMVDDINSPKTGFSEEGTFCFEVESLEPGQYLILIQPIKGFTTGNASMALIVDEKTKQKIEIKYPFEVGDASNLDLKNVVINTPK